MVKRRKNKKPTKKVKRNNKLRNIIYILLGALGTFLILSLILIAVVKTTIINETDIVEFETALENNWIEEVVFKENVGTITYIIKSELFDEKKRKEMKLPKEYKDKKFYYVNETKVHSNYFILNADMYKKVKSDDIKFQVKSGISLMTVIVVTIYSLLFLIFLIFIVQFVLKTSKVPLDYIKDEPTKFSDVGGLTEVKEELVKIIDYLENKDSLGDYIDSIPKGILFEGLPGNGKTLLARVIAGESNTPFFYISGSDIEGMYVSLGASKVRKIFKRVKAVAKKEGKAILFIDELDSVGIKRERRTVVETSQTINAILTELDGFHPSDNILVIGATNLASQLDSALIRSGRFDRIINIPNPSEEDRYEILNLYLQKRIDKVESSIYEVNYLHILAKQTSEMSSSDLSRLINDAFLLAYDERKNVTVTHLREAYLRIRMGLPRKMTLSDYDRNIIAHHESAHAVVSMATSPLGYESFAYGTIRPYGESGGHVSLIPEATFLNKRSDYFNKVYMLLAGRAVEDIILENDFTDGASHDLMQVNNILYQYLIKSGMSESNPNVFIEGQLSDYKEKWLQDELNSLRNKLYDETLIIVKGNLPYIELLKEYLLENNEIDFDVITEMFKDVFPNNSKRVIHTDKY